MKYLINVDCYLVDKDGEVSPLVDPTFDLNFESKTNATVLKDAIKNKMSILKQYVLIKDKLLSGDDELVSTVNDSLVNYEAYFGKTGKEVIKEKIKK